jgi:hypothetical protein
VESLLLAFVLRQRKMAAKKEEKTLEILKTTTRFGELAQGFLLNQSPPLVQTRDKQFSLFRFTKRLILCA